MEAKRILVTGGNAGIGLALCKQLAIDHKYFVYMGTRNLQRGEAGLKSITDVHPTSNIELLEIDVNDDKSVTTAAGVLKAKGITLYALVNNAGIGFRTGGNSSLLNTNFYGPKRVSEAMIELLDAKEGRIVNVSSGVASMWLRNESAEVKALFSSPDTSWDDLDAAVRAAESGASMGGYGLSKAGLTCYTMIQAKIYPNLCCTSLSPGFIRTALTEGFGARLTPEQGTVSLIKCLFGDVVSGYFYGSDGLRSPLTVTRDPGTPEYQGEADPDASRYNTTSELAP